MAEASCCQTSGVSGLVENSIARRFTGFAGREAIVLECDHPRTVEVAADRPDFAIRVAVDRADGVILRLEESIGGRVTRDAVVTTYDPDVALPPSAFAFTFPAGTTPLY